MSPGKAGGLPKGNYGVINLVNPIRWPNSQDGHRRHHAKTKIENGCIAFTSQIEQKRRRTDPLKDHILPGSSGCVGLSDVVYLRLSRIL